MRGLDGVVAGRSPAGKVDRWRDVLSRVGPFLPELGGPVGGFGMCPAEFLLISRGQV